MKKVIDKIFNLDWNEYKDSFQKNGYLSIENGISEELRLELLKLFNDGKKHDIRVSSRVRYEVPTLIQKEFIDAISFMTDTSRDKVVLSEQHFLRHNTNHHSLHYDQPWEEVVVLMILDFPEGTDTYESIYINAPVLPIDMPKWKRDFVYWKNVDNIYDSNPLEVRTKVGDVIFFRASSLCHKRFNPKGIIHYRLAGNTFGFDHKYNNSEEMMDDTYPVEAPQKLPNWFKESIKVVDEEPNIIYKKDIFKRFWQGERSLSFKLYKKFIALQSKVLRKVYNNVDPKYY